MLQTMDGILDLCRPQVEHPVQAKTDIQQSSSQKQSPRSDVWDWDFSLDRKVQKIRWDDGEGGKWLCDVISGTCQVLGADGTTGHVTMRGQLQLRQLRQEGGVVAEIFRDRNAPPHEKVEGLVLPNHSFIRLCYHRFRKNFRFRIEKTGELWYVDNYVGDINITRKDGGPHAHHKGPAILEGKITENHYRTAHFYGRL